MTHIPAAPAPPDAPLQSPLPRAHVLTYITGDNTAPRLRRIIFWGNTLLAIVNFAFFIVGALCTAWLVTESMGSGGIFVAGAAAPPMRTLLLNALMVYAPVVLLTLLPLLCAITLALTAAPASRGRRLATHATTLACLPLLAVGVLASTGGFMAVVATFLDAHHELGPATLGAIVGTFFLLATLLLKDLLAYAAWARKNPVEEKPRTPFLPLRQLPR